MKPRELLRLVWINITQNKFKVVMTSIGIIVGAATIVMVIAIGKGGQADVADQFKNLNAGAIDISYAGDTPSAGGGPDMREMSDMGNMPSVGDAPDMENMPSFGGMDMENRINQENITLTSEDVDDILTFSSGVSSATISYTTRTSVDGGDLEEACSYTIAGVEASYEEISNLELAVGAFISDADNENKEKVCVLGASVAEEIFGSAIEAYGSIIYIDDRMYVVNGILASMGTVSSGISPDDSVFIPYATGVKYIVGTKVDPTITVLAADVNNVDGVIAEVTDVLALSYPNAEFTFEDAGSKMEAAEASNEILTMLLIAMAAIVFVVGGIGIMNVLFVSVKERTNEIGILKAIGCSQKDILFEFLAEAAAISMIGGIMGNVLSLIITPIVQYLGVRVELSAAAFVIAMIFAVATGTIFGFYPAYKASKLVPVEALGAE